LISKQVGQMSIGNDAVTTAQQAPTATRNVAMPSDEAPKNGNIFLILRRNLL
jgi:hypothetical protein